MNINILYFASLADTLGTKQESLDLNTQEPATIKSLKQFLIQRGPEWQTALNAASTRCAVNQNLVEDCHALSENCEVAFFPPVTGG